MVRDPSIVSPTLTGVFMFASLELSDAVKLGALGVRDVAVGASIFGGVSRYDF